MPLREDGEKQPAQPPAAMKGPQYLLEVHILQVLLREGRAEKEWQRRHYLQLCCRRIKGVA